MVDFDSAGCTEVLPAGARPAPPDPGPPPSGRPAQRSFFAIFPSIALPMFLAVVDQTIVATALPAIAAETQNVARASWVIVAYLIASTIAAPIYGRLADNFGRRRLMFGALVIFILASILCAVSPSIEMLAAARVVQGLGGGGLMTLSQALVGEAGPPRQRARYQGYLAAVAVCANTFGPVAGGYLTEHLGWRSVFLINIPVGLVAVALTCSLKHQAPAKSNWEPDPLGLALFTVFVTTALMALEQVQRVDFTALPLLGGLVAACLLSLALLVRQESRARSPLIPLSLLRQPAVWRSDMLAACHGAALVSLISFLPIYLEVVRGLSPAATGLLLVPLTVGIGSGSLLTGRLVSKTGMTTIFPVLGLVLVTANLLALALWAEVLSEAALGWLLLWNGLFMGTVMGVVQVTVQCASGPLRIGEAAASVQFSRSIGAAFGTALVATVLFAVLSIRSPEAAHLFASLTEHAAGATATPDGAEPAIRTAIAQAFGFAFGAIAAFTGAGFLLALSIPLRRI